MNENSFNADLAAGLRSQNIFAHKLPDLARGVVKPFDIVANCQGRFWAIEGKLKKVKLKPGETVFPDDLIVIDRYEKTFRPHQIPNLKMIEDQGGYGFVAIYLAEDRPGSRLKAGWLMELKYFLRSNHWTVAALNYRFCGTQRLLREPNVGWIVSHQLIVDCGLAR